MTLHRTIAITAALIPLALAACSGSAATPSPWPQQPSSSDEEVVNVKAFMDLMGADGSTVEYIGQTPLGFLTVPAQTIRVNGQDVLVFEYSNVDAAKAEAATVSADGWEIAGQYHPWNDDQVPYFYTVGRIIAVFPGRDQPTIDKLNRIFGGSFAGGE